MTTFDLILERVGLCSLSFYKKMQQGYAQVISMKTRQVQRLEVKLKERDSEIIELKLALEIAEGNQTLKAFRKLP